MEEADKKEGGEAEAARKRDKGDKEEEDDEGSEEEVQPTAKRTRHSIKQETMLQQVMGGGALSPRKEPRRGDDEDEDGEDDDDDDDDDDDEQLRSVEGFLKAAAAYKNLVFGSAAAKVAGSYSLDGDVPPEKVEHKFWRLAQGLERGEKSGSGSREPDATHLAVAQPGRDGGGGFPAPGDHAEEPYASSPWNLRQLLRQRDCVLAHLGGALPDEQRQLAFGMLFGCQSWQVHEHFMYGLSYLHIGAPRTWYGISGHDAEAIGALLASESSQEDAAKCTFALPALMSPSMLCGHELQVSRVLQNPGEFVLTMPRAFHASFSHGFNVEERAAFGTVDWLAWGARGAALHRQLRARPAVCFEEVVIKAVRGDPTVRAAVALMDPLLAIIERYGRQLAALEAAGVTRVVPIMYLGDGGTEPAPCCVVSMQPCWLLCVIHEDGQPTCAEHTPPGCACSGGQKTVRVSRSREQLAELQAVLEARLAQRQKWLEEAKAALETTPTLEQLESLLAEARSLQLQVSIAPASLPARPELHLAATASPPPPPRPLPRRRSRWASSCSDCSSRGSSGWHAPTGCSARAPSTAPRWSWS